MTERLPKEGRVMSFLEHFFPKTPIELLVLIVSYIFLSVYDIKFNEHCTDLGIMLHPRMADTFSVWRHRMSFFYRQKHVRAVKCRQNGKDPVPKAQWVPTELDNPLYLELCRRTVAIRWRLGDGEIFHTPEETMFLVTHKWPAVGEKVRNNLTEEYVTEMAYKLDTIVVIAVVKDYILMGVIQGNKWIFLVPIRFIHLVEMHLKKHSSEKKAFFMDIPGLEKNAPDTLISPEPSKDLNKDKKLIFDPKGRFVIKLGNGFDIPVHLDELMTHLYKSKEVNTLVTNHWDILSKNSYVLSRHCVPQVGV